MPNSLTWGPDGWLYGLNGVFNYCDVDYGPQESELQSGSSRVEVHVRCVADSSPDEGVSDLGGGEPVIRGGSPFNNDGEMFLSACVIDHLWHMTETGYYIRQGPYPPHTWPIGSIVKHKHQKAAYCGITWFDSDCYPEPYRNVLYMGNIHGGCINADVLARNGSTYAGQTASGFPAKARFDLPDNTIAKTGDEKKPQLGGSPDRQRSVVHAGRSEDRSGRVPVHPRLVRPVSLLPGRQRGPGRDRPRERAAVSARLRRAQKPAKSAILATLEPTNAPTQPSMVATSTSARPPRQILAELSAKDAGIEAGARLPPPHDRRRSEGSSGGAAASPVDAGLGRAAPDGGRPQGRTRNARRRRRLVFAAPCRSGSGVP